MTRLASWAWFRVLLLPLLLIVSAGNLLGIHYESNDDYVMELLLRGTAAAAPVGNLHLWWHGWSHVLAAAFQAAPTVPWYGLLCYGMTTVALMCFFYAIEEVGEALELQGFIRLTAELLIFATAFVYNVMQMNFTRPAFLLGAGAGLLALVGLLVRRIRPVADGPTRLDYWWLALPVLLAGWLVRTDAGMLGLALVLPLGLLVPRRAVALRIASLVVVVLIPYLAIAANRAPAETHYLKINADRARVADYHNYTAHLQTPTDSLAFQSIVSYWGLPDTALVNPHFYHTALPAGSTLTVIKQNATEGIAPAIVVIGYRWFAAFFLLGLVAVSAWRRWWHSATARQTGLTWLVYNGYFWALFLGITVFFHMVARILYPALTVYTLVNLLMLGLAVGPVPGLTVRHVAKWQLLGATVCLVAVALHGRFLWNLRREAAELQSINEHYLAGIAAATENKVLVNQGMYIAFDALSPLRCYPIGEHRKLLMLTGWAAFDPSQPALYKSLTGHADLPGALAVLVQQQHTVWALPGYFAPFFSRYWRLRGLEPALQKWAVLGGEVPKNYPALCRPIMQTQP